MWSEVRQSARSFRSKPVLPTIAIVMLMLAIAGNITIFGIVDAVVLEPLPVSDQDDVWGNLGV